MGTVGVGLATETITFDAVGFSSPFCSLGTLAVGEDVLFIAASTLLSVSFNSSTIFRLAGVNLSWSMSIIYDYFSDGYYVEFNFYALLVRDVLYTR